MTPRRFPELHDHDWLSEHYIMQGMTARAIADQLGCTQDYVRHALGKAGLSGSGGRRNVRYPQLSDREWVEVQYAQHQSMRAIARELGCSVNAVKLALLRFGIQRRRSGHRPGYEPAGAQA